MKRTMKLELPRLLPGRLASRRLGALVVALAAGTYVQAASATTFLISPVAFDFGDVSVGASSATQSVIVKNVSSSSQTLSNLTGGGAGVFGGATDCTGRTLAPGGTCRVDYRFSPTSSGSTTGSASLFVNGQSADFSFKGNGVDAFRLTPLSFDFGSVNIGATSAAQIATVTNVSNFPQTLSAVAGGGAGVFGGATNCAGRTLAPGESCLFSYAFTPTTVGPATLSSTVSINGQSTSFSFKGTGYSSRGTVIPPLLITPLSFDFGDVSVGAYSATQSVMITNVSSSSQTLSSLLGGGAGVFGGATDCTGRTLAPGGSCRFDYRFVPTEYGTTSGTATLTVNGQTATFSFAGNGVDSFLISPIGFDFGEVDPGTISPSQTVEIVNVSGTQETVNFAGGGAGVFGGATNCVGKTLAPDESCEVSYAFTPIIGGSVEGTATLYVNDQSATISFVPEPDGSALLGFAFVGIGIIRDRRARRASDPGSDGRDSRHHTPSPEDRTFAQ